MPPAVKEAAAKKTQSSLPATIKPVVKAGIKVKARAVGNGASGRAAHNESNASEVGTGHDSKRQKLQHGIFQQQNQQADTASKTAVTQASVSAAPASGGLADLLGGYGSDDDSQSDS